MSIQPQAELAMIESIKEELDRPRVSIKELESYAARLDSLYLKMANIRGKPDFADDLALMVAYRPQLDSLMERIQRMLPKDDSLDVILASKDVDLAAVSAMFM